MPLVYDELRKLAVAKLAHEKPGQTLQATALVHEAYLRLVGGRGDRGQGTGGGEEQAAVAGQTSETDWPNPDLRSPTPAVWNSRGHFFGAAAEAMRRILIGQARRKASLKAGGQRQRVDLADVEPEIQGRNWICSSWTRLSNSLRPAIPARQPSSSCGFSPD